MEILVQTINIKNREQVLPYINKTLTNKFNHYPFLKIIDVKVSAGKFGEHNISLQTKPEKGKRLFVEASDRNINKALKECSQKLQAMIERYKEVHYHSAKKTT